ncbi:MAG: redoxin domain-containing protein [Betaproteobacteria bacterium]|nr:redoxin domain-containing protein [Betaproteobacteria bacterium]
MSASARAAEPKAIQFTFTSIEGKPIRLTDFRGRWVLVNFWAPWCPLCKIGVPALNELNRRPDLAVIGVSLDYGPNEDAIRAAMSQSNIRYTAIVAGGARRDSNSAYRQVGPVDFFPTSYLYDPTGEVVMFIPGQVRASRVIAFMESWRAPERAGEKPTLIAMQTDKLGAFLSKRYGGKGAQAYKDWRKLVEALVQEPAEVQLARVNDYFNQRIRVAEDREVWKREDYWTTLGELLGTGRGDSEDFVIAKYFTLQALNVPADKMRLVYVKSRAETRDQGGPAHASGSGFVHMVLSYSESAESEPLLLDHRVSQVMPASKRTDLKPVYSFNSLHVWDEKGRSGGPGDLAIWEETLRRARAEGFE